MVSFNNQHFRYVNLPLNTALPRLKGIFFAYTSVEAVIINAPIPWAPTLELCSFSSKPHTHNPSHRIR